MSKRKLIGLPIWNQGENSVGATKPYLEYLNRFGSVVLLGPDTFIPELDLLVLPGGKDVFNGNKEEFSYMNSDNERFLEWFDANTLPKYIQSKTPIYGICRGAQAIFRHFGMPLVQNIWWDHGYSKDESDLKAHSINYYGAFRAELKSNGYLDLPKQIESFHHQGLLANNISSEFEILATDGYDPEGYRIVEFARHKSLPIIAQQGHPERSWGVLPEYLINSLLK